MAHHDVPGHIAMRTKRYKLILFHGSGGDPRWSERSAGRTPPAWEPYDLKTDPHETVNLAHHPEYATVLSDLKQRFRSLRTRIKADDASVVVDPKNRRRAETVNAVIDEFWDDNDENRCHEQRIADLGEDCWIRTTRESYNHSPRAVPSQRRQGLTPGVTAMQAERDARDVILLREW